MLQKDVYEQFKVYFPQIASNVDVWFPNGKNSIRIRQTDKQEFIFTYNNSKNWSFETIEYFIKHMKGEKR